MGSWQWIISSSFMYQSENASALKSLPEDFMNSILGSNSFHHTAKAKTASLQSAELPRGKAEDIQVTVIKLVVKELARAVLTLLTPVITIYASASNYSTNRFTLKQLISWMEKSGKRSLVTWLYVKLFHICSSLLFFASAVLALAGASSGHNKLLLLLVPVGMLLQGLSLLYFDLICTLGLVASVVEDNCKGFAAIRKAVDIIKGRRVQGLVLLLLSVSASWALHWFLAAITKSNHSEITHDFASRVVLNAFGGAKALYTDVVYTVFYYSCKRKVRSGDSVAGDHWP